MTGAMTFVCEFLSIRSISLRQKSFAFGIEFGTLDISAAALFVFFATATRARIIPAGFQSLPALKSIAQTDGDRNESIVRPPVFVTTKSPAWIISIPIKGSPPLNCPRVTCMNAKPVLFGSSIFTRNTGLRVIEFTPITCVIPICFKPQVFTTRSVMTDPLAPVSHIAVQSE